MCFLALLPWWRNHDYLRDLYDYGGFMAVNARMAAGERRGNEAHPLSFRGFAGNATGRVGRKQDY